MRRYTITLGASSTTQGKVLTASSTMSIDGTPVALEGDSVFCPACRSEGKIKCTGPRIPMTFHGRPIALQDDLCACSCAEPPRLTASQSRHFQETADTEKRGSAHVQPTCLYNDRFRLTDSTSGLPIAKTEYAIERASGAIEYGTTDENGATHLLSDTTTAEDVHIYL